MHITDFNQEVAKREGGEEEVNIAQIGEVVRHVKDILLEKAGIDIYEVIKKI